MKNKKILPRIDFVYYLIKFKLTFLNRINNRTLEWLRRYMEPLFSVLFIFLLVPCPRCTNIKVILTVACVFHNTEVVYEFQLSAVCYSDYEYVWETPMQLVVVATDQAGRKRPAPPSVSLLPHARIARPRRGAGMQNAVYNQCIAVVHAGPRRVQSCKLAASNPWQRFMYLPALQLQPRWLVAEFIINTAA